QPISYLCSDHSDVHIKSQALLSTPWTFNYLVQSPGHLISKHYLMKKVVRLMRHRPVRNFLYGLNTKFVKWITGYRADFTSQGDMFYLPVMMINSGFETFLDRNSVMMQKRIPTVYLYGERDRIVTNEVF